MLDFEFATYCAKHGKIYEDVEEYERRKTLFHEMDQFIQKHNNSGHGYSLGHNSMSDQTKEERSAKLGLRPR